MNFFQLSLLLEQKLRTHNLKAGTILYHGTSSKKFFEKDGPPDPPAWFSTSEAVAKKFMKWHPGNNSRVIAYRLIEDYSQLAVIESKEDMDILMGDGPRYSSIEMAEYVCENTPYNGWYVPHNYPEGDDILLCDTSSLEIFKF